MGGTAQQGSSHLVRILPLSLEAVYLWNPPVFTSSIVCTPRVTWRSKYNDSLDDRAHLKQYSFVLAKRLSALAEGPCSPSPVSWEEGGERSLCAKNYNLQVLIFSEGWVSESNTFKFWSCYSRALLQLLEVLVFGSTKSPEFLEHLTQQSVNLISIRRNLKYCFPKLGANPVFM